MIKWSSYKKLVQIVELKNSEIVLATWMKGKNMFYELQLINSMHVKIAVGGQLVKIRFISLSQSVANKNMWNMKPAKTYCSISSKHDSNIPTVLGLESVSMQFNLKYDK